MKKVVAQSFDTFTTVANWIKSALEVKFKLSELTYATFYQKNIILSKAYKFQKVSLEKRETFSITNFLIQVILFYFSRNRDFEIVINEGFHKTFWSLRSNHVAYQKHISRMFLKI